jgi:hypothetical protein
MHRRRRQDDSETPLPHAGERSRTARFDEWVRRSPPVLLAGLALFLFVTIGQAINVGRSATNWLHDTYDWRPAEYARLGRLHSDFTLAAFESELGPPLFEDESYDHRWTEYLFRRRGYWVQALTRRGGDTVGAFAVTACDRSFHPTFYAFRTKVVLNRSRLADFHGDPFTSFTYTIPADVLPWFFVTTGGGRVSNFQSFAWGADGACWSLNYVAYIPFHPGKGMNEFQGRIRLAKLPKKFARALVIDTFAEWGPKEFAWPNSSFHIGVDEFHLNALSTSAGPHG